MTREKVLYGQFKLHAGQEIHLDEIVEAFGMENSQHSRTIVRVYVYRMMAKLLKAGVRVVRVSSLGRGNKARFFVPKEISEIRLEI